MKIEDSALVRGIRTGLVMLAFAVLLGGIALLLSSCATAEMLAVKAATCTAAQLWQQNMCGGLDAGPPQPCPAPDAGVP